MAKNLFHEVHTEMLYAIIPLIQNRCKYFFILDLKSDFTLKLEQIRQFC